MCTDVEWSEGGKAFRNRKVNLRVLYRSWSFPSKLVCPILILLSCFPYFSSLDMHACAILTVILHSFVFVCLLQIRSADGSVSFALEHNVCGREIYAEGTADAVLFVAAQDQVR